MAMVLLLGLVKVLLNLFKMSFWGSFGILLDLGVLCFLVLFPFGIVLGLVTADTGVESKVVDCADDAVPWFRGSGSGRPRIRLNRKTPAHLVVFWGSISSTSLEEVASFGAFQFFSS